MGIYPVGFDISPEYTSIFTTRGGMAVLGSADMLPFANCSFDGVWSIGLLHHLSDNLAQRAITEMIRVCRFGGYVAIFDAVMPEQFWQLPIAWILRKIDRGQNMRCQKSFEFLFLDQKDWICERAIYSLLGHEGLFCMYLKK